MSRLPVANALTCLAFAAAALLSATGPASAQDSGDRIGSWKVGGLAYAVGTQSETRVSDLLQDKVRIGASLIPQLESVATVRPFLSAAPSTPDMAGASGLGNVRAGILIDVPLGSFVFTPSFGAGSLARSPRESGPTTEFRSQLELGYEFDNKSRFSLGYSRIATDGNPTDGTVPVNNVFGLYYRLPFGGQ
ncbi:hypothetical protein [Azospirillum thermophilum]|uniref:hypothetical protein n=1 Tax=Azospirillum thermophilum TaxID=2202148 RepID=UPI001FEC01EE|nr:hypothetical protein [Azospirillum thermophilum]